MDGEKNSRKALGAAGRVMGLIDASDDCWRCEYSHAIYCTWEEVSGGGRLYGVYLFI